MEMRDLATIVRRIVSLVLTIAIVVAPIAPAVAACMSPSAAKAKVAATTPCDMPCKDCVSKTAKKSCQGECVCVNALFDRPSGMSQPAPSSFRPVPYKFAPLVAMARPPDPPPPRTLFV
jgi:hypothetical protein